MTDDELETARHRSILDRLEQLLADVERFEAMAWDAGNSGEAVRWFALAAALRAVLAMFHDALSP